MKRMFLCGVTMLGSAAIAVAQSGPFSILFPDHELVLIDPGYQTTTSITSAPENLAAIEYSENGLVYGVDWTTDTLLRADPATGTFETVGPLGFDLLGAADLDEDDAGQLWMLPCNTGALYRIDATTGAASFECQTATMELCGLATFDNRRWTTTLLTEPPADPGCGFEILQANTVSTSAYLDSAADNWIFAIHYNVTPGLETSTVSRIDPVTGAEESLGIFTYHGTGDGSVLNGITFDPNDQPSLSVPVFGWPGVAAMTVLLLAAAWWVLQRGPD
jgi:hypothetical protein